MKNLFLLVLLFFTAEFSYTQEINFLWLHNDVKKSVAPITAKGNYDFVLASFNPRTGLPENFSKTIPDSIPVFFFPDISYREFLIESFLNDEFTLKRKFSFSKNDILVLGLNYKLNETLNISGLLKEDENWLIENLSVNMKPKRLYVITYESKQIIPGNNFSNIPDTLLPDEIYFISLNDLKSKVGKSQTIAVLLNNNEISLKYFSNKKIRKKSIKAVRYKLAAQNNAKRQIKNIKIIAEEYKNSFSFSPPVFEGSSFYLTDKDGIVTCLDSTRKILWEYDAMGTIISQPVLLKNLLIFTTMEGDVIILDKTSGEQIESLGIDDAIVSSPVLFTYTGNKELLYGNRSGKTDAIAVATASGSVYAYSVPAFEELWINEDNKFNFEGELITANNKIIFFNSKGILHNIDPATGWTIWKWQEKTESAKLISNFLVSKKNLFFVLSNNKLYKMDLLLGKRLWKTKTGKISGRIEFDKESNIILTNAEQIKIISQNTGKVLRKIKVKENNFGLSSNLVFTDTEVYFGSKNGKVYRITKSKNIKSFTTGINPVSYVMKVNEGIFIIFDFFNNFKIINLNL